MLHSSYLLLDDSPGRCGELLWLAGERMLPVFSFEAEARMFLQFEAPRGGWRVANITDPDGILSALRRSYPAVRHAILDPLPAMLSDRLPERLYGSGLVELENFERLRIRGQEGSS